MHKFIMWFFRTLRDFISIINLTGSFLIFLIAMYWIESEVGLNWTWLNFAKPFLNGILDFTQKTFIDFIPALSNIVNLKYIVSILLIIGIVVLLIYILEKTEEMKSQYEAIHIEHKLAVEKSFNKKLKNNIKKEQQQINKYMILIHTRIKKKFSHKEISLNLDDLNKQMNDFIKTQTNIQATFYDNGFLYYFDIFDEIDNVLDIMFKLIKSDAPLEYSICIQVGDDIKKLQNLTSIENYNKITFFADTLLKYKYNKSHRYGTQSIGFYQKDEGTFEIYEFQEIL